jgi:hypothetical protein
MNTGFNTDYFFVYNGGECACANAQGGVFDVSGDLGVCDVNCINSENYGQNGEATVFTCGGAGDSGAILGASVYQTN